MDTPHETTPSTVQPFRGSVRSAHPAALHLRQATSDLPPEHAGEDSVAQPKPVEKRGRDMEPDEAEKHIRGPDMHVAQRAVGLSIFSAWRN